MRPAEPATTPSSNSGIAFVQINNGAAVLGNFGLQWNDPGGGGIVGTELVELPPGVSFGWQLTNPPMTDATQCWAVVFPVGGSTHQSHENFTVPHAGTIEVSYNLDGGLGTLNWWCTGCND
jgi:hypothetical protein